ncbi:hypothetical protein FNJ47_46915, partial [Bradyrhizobium sp. UFLA 03-164]|nr:hypothetical protein [Bradyrhizobium uaiense]
PISARPTSWLGTVSRSRLFSHDDTALCGRLFLFVRRVVPTSCAAQPRFAKSSPEPAIQPADARGLLDGLIWPKTGSASIV